MKSLFVFILVVFISACSSHVQTTSGEAYLEKYQDVHSTKNNNASGSQSFDELVLQVAQVEPTLRFPARIGLARIDNGRLSTIPGVELEAWMKTREKLGKNFGDFVPLNTLVAEMVANSISKTKHDLSRNTMNKIRLGAARQHLDAVLVYETYSKSNSKSNILSIADVTIIGGYLLPSRAIEAEGYANAMLIDVVQGYPYGTVDVVLEKDTKFSTAWGNYGAKSSHRDKVKSKAAIKLTEEVESMFTKLRIELAEKRQR